MTHMSFNQFMARLRVVQYQAEVLEGGRIRFGRVLCPLQMVGNHPDFSQCGNEIGLSKTMTLKIAEASDYPGRHKVMRNRLLKACGLSHSGDK